MTHKTTNYINLHKKPLARISNISQTRRQLHMIWNFFSLERFTSFEVEAEFLKYININ